MKKIRLNIITVILAMMPVLGMAQSTKIPVMKELIEIGKGDDDTSEVLSVFDMPKDDGTHRYYLCAGHLGIGDEVIQINLDPVFQLFIPLGTTLDETMESLQSMQSLLKEKPGTNMEVSGCLAFGFPSDELETVTLTCRKVLLGRNLEFSVERDGYIRANYIQRSDLNSLVSGVKFYRKIHPKEL